MCTGFSGCLLSLCWLVQRSLREQLVEGRASEFLSPACDFVQFIAGEVVFPVPELLYVCFCGRHESFVADKFCG